MNDFLDNLTSTLNEEFNVSITENGALGYRTSGNALLDLNFAVSSMRAESKDKIKRRFTNTFHHDLKLATKWLFFAGDIRQGLGERRLFRLGLIYLANAYPEILVKVLEFVPEYTRWDNYLPLLDTPLCENVCNIFKKQLEKDIADMKAKKPVSLLAKWLPSINASSEVARKYAKIIIRSFGWTAKTYRKTLSQLRAHLNVVEVLLSAKRWEKIDYSSVPSKANLIYRDAFLLHDENRREEYLRSVQMGSEKINSDVAYPHDIVQKYMGKSFFDEISNTPVDRTLEEMWKALPDYVQGNSSTICVADGSGSMFTKLGNSNTYAISVANSLAIYFSERCSGAFKNKYITFSARPQLVDLSWGLTLRNKLEIALNYCEVANTNIYAVFDLILKTAVNAKMEQKDLPKNVLILSDMEFDFAISDRLDEKLFQTISRKYEDAGYNLPRLIFWNICGRTNTIPLRENKLGVALVSGFSPSIVDMVLSDNLDPLGCLLEKLNSERYKPLDEALSN